MDLKSLMLKCGFNDIAINSNVIKGATFKASRAPRILNRILYVPRLSTPAIGSLIRQIVGSMPANHVYLNIGVWNGYSFFAGLLSDPPHACHGVDSWRDDLGKAPKDAFHVEYNKHRHEESRFYDMDYIQYFKTLDPKTKIGLYFYDADHDYGPTLEALDLSDPFIPVGGLIMVDDINREDPCGATMDFIESSKGRYRAALWVTCDNGMDPVWWNGIAILEKIA